MTLLVALRHAATSWNLEKKLQGRRDIPLSDAGVRSLEERALPENYKTISWYCSPLLRARQTADVLGLKYQIEDSLIEMDWGDWEGQTVKMLRQQLGDKMQQEEDRGLLMQPPNGESPAQVKQRVLTWLNSIPQNQPTGIIAHKGVLRVLVSTASGWDMKVDCPLKIDWNRPLEFTRDAGRPNGLASRIINPDC